VPIINGVDALEHRLAIASHRMRHAVVVVVGPLPHVAYRFLDDDIPIPEVDRERLEGMVEAYRRSIFNLYRLAHTQGAIDVAKDIKRRIKEPA